MTEIRKQVDTRLNEIERLLKPLQEEYEQLKSAAIAFGSDARATLSGNAARGRRRGRSSASTTTTRRRGRPRGSGGRAQQALALVRRRPGVTISEMAKQMKISPNYLYRVLPQLEKDGKVKKQGRGYHPAS